MQYKCVLRRYRVKISNFSGGFKEKKKVYKKRNIVKEASVVGSDCQFSD